MLSTEDVSAIMILVKVKNSRCDTVGMQSRLFTSMSPQRYGGFDEYVETRPPVVRRLFALASP